MVDLNFQNPKNSHYHTPDNLPQNGNNPGNNRNRGEKRFFFHFCKYEFVKCFKKIKKKKNLKKIKIKILKIIHLKN